MGYSILAAGWDKFRSKHCRLGSSYISRMIATLEEYLHHEKPARSLMFNLVEENKTFYTERQFERAKRACDLFHALARYTIN